MGVSKQTCSAGVTAQRGRPLQRGHRGRAAHSLHCPHLGMLRVRGPGARQGGVDGVQVKRRGRGWWGWETGVGSILSRLLLKNGELRDKDKTVTSGPPAFAGGKRRGRLSQDPALRCATLPECKLRSGVAYCAWRWTICSVYNTDSWGGPFQRGKTPNIQRQF